jgi:geranylgeranyl diphosphate synthase, type I
MHIKLKTQMIKTIPNIGIAKSLGMDLGPYYKNKIGFLNACLDETVPKGFANDMLRKLEMDETQFMDIQEALSNPMRQYLKARGKLFRPLLTCLFIEAYGKDPFYYKKMIAASEMIHSASLMLDDIADLSFLRRGEPCAHQIYGIPGAANASSALTLYALKLIQDSQLNFDEETRLKLFRAMLWEHYVTGLGSALDLGWVKEGKNDISESQYFQHVLFRSCSYTYRHAALLGAITASVSDVEQKKVFDFSSNLGLAFQLMDDVLNLKPQSKKWGKVIGEDITEGKRSLLVIYTLNKSNNKDCASLLSILNDRTHNPDNIKQAIGIMEKYNAFEYVTGKAGKFVTKAIKIARELTISDSYKSLLVQFSNYIITRAE